MEASALHAPAGLTRIALPSALLRLRSDEQLIALFRAGNDDAFRVIHDRYRTRLFAYARQMLGGSRTDAEDALQDVFLRAYNALRVDSRPVILKAWLYRVAHNRCIDQIRRPVPPAAELFDLSRTPSHDPLAQAEQREDLRRLVADVQALPEQQRSALLMRELEGLSYADLAVALETSVPAVKSLLVRARIGLVEAAEARNTACAEIRDDLTLSFGKGVRASALARRHMRECDGCRSYRGDLRAVQSGLSALAPPAHPLALVAKLLGIGGASGGAAAGGSAAAGGGAAVVGGGVVAGTTAKVAAVVCCAAITAGGAVELKRHAADTARGSAGSSASARERTDAPTTRATTIRRQRTAPPGAAAAQRTGAAGIAARAEARRAAAQAAQAMSLATAADVISPHVDDAASGAATTGAAMGEEETMTGGALAPEEAAASEEAAPGATTGTSSSPGDKEAASASGSEGAKAPTAAEGTSTAAAQPAAGTAATPTGTASASTGTTGTSAPGQ